MDFFKTWFFLDHSEVLPGVRSAFGTGTYIKPRSRSRLPGRAGGACLFSAMEIINPEGLKRNFKGYSFSFQRSCELSNFTWLGDGVISKGKVWGGGDFR